MDFGLSEEQELLQETVRGFVENECPATRLRELFDEGTGHDPTLWSALAEMGIAGLIVPEELGGAGLELLDLALVAEILGETAMPDTCRSIRRQMILRIGQTPRSLAAINPIWGFWQHSGQFKRLF